MVLVMAIGKLGGAPAERSTRAEREASAAAWGNRLFIPALTIPAVTLLGTLTLKYVVVNGTPLVDPKQVTLISLGIATVVALDRWRRDAATAGSPRRSSKRAV